MFKIFKKNINKKEDFQYVAKKQLKANKEVLKSLRDYDQGRKEISTANVGKHLHNIQASL